VSETEPQGAPTLTIAEAARAAGVNRSTVHRALADGRLHGAARGADGHWQIPPAALEQLGWSLRAPAAADVEPEPELDLADELQRLRAELETERAKRHTAEAIAAERAERVEDLRIALRMLGPGPPVPSSSTSTPATPAPAAPGDEAPRRGWRRLLGG
jgi:excisionase family DNA binding protein